MTKDPRTYIRLHDGMPDHPKIAGLSRSAKWSLVECWCYCSRYLTDGLVSHTFWHNIPSRSRHELVLNGLAEVHENGVRMHDYLKHQHSRDEISELRERRATAGSLGGKARAKGLASATANATAPAEALAQALAQANANQTSSNVDVDVDVGVLETSSSTPLTAPQRSRGTRLPEDWQPTERDLEWATGEKRMSLAMIRRATEMFANHFHAAAGSRAVKVDWSATWKNWLLRDQAEHRPDAKPDDWMNASYVPGRT